MSTQETRQSLRLRGEQAPEIQDLSGRRKRTDKTSNPSNDRKSDSNTVTKQSNKATMAQTNTPTATSPSNIANPTMENTKIPSLLQVIQSSDNISILEDDNPTKDTPKQMEPSQKMVCSETQIPSSILSDTPSIGSLQRSDVSASTSGLSFSNPKLSKDPPTDLENKESKLIKNIKSTVKNLETWTTKSLDILKNAMTQDVKLMENYLRVITNRVDTNEKDINIINHKNDDINSTELEEMTLKTKLDSLVEGMKEEILEETKFEFLPLWKKYKALEEKYEKLNTKYNYMVKENFSLHNDIAMLREDMANINSTIKICNAKKY